MAWKEVVGTRRRRETVNQVIWEITLTAPTDEAMPLEGQLLASVVTGASFGTTLPTVDAEPVLMNVTHAKKQPNTKVDRVVLQFFAAKVES